SITDPINKREAIADGCISENNTIQQNSPWFCEYTKRATGFIKIGDLASNRYIDESDSGSGSTEGGGESSGGEDGDENDGVESSANNENKNSGSIGSCRKPNCSGEGQTYSETIGRCVCQPGWTLSSEDSKCYKQCSALSGEGYIEHLGVNNTDINAYEDIPITNHSTNITLECINNYTSNDINNNLPAIYCDEGEWKWRNNSPKCHFSGSKIFEHTGSVQEFVLNFPVGTELTFAVWGGQGGSGSVASDKEGGHNGGKGGFSKGIYTVTDSNINSTLYVYVGGVGSVSKAYSASYTLFHGGGWNGGGDGGVQANHVISGGGGGGASDIRVSKTDTLTGKSNDPRLIVAGGGGGKSCGNGGDGGVGGGGNGGGQNGGDGAETAEGRGGHGGLINKGGGGSIYDIDPKKYGSGGLGLGGGATRKAGDTPYTYNRCPGGGGGGWYGGGGGGGEHSGDGEAGGGGGSGYCNGAQLGSCSGASGQNEGNGIVKICWGSDNSCN
ncbi:MAG: hypothetical protein LBH46_02250, partial [Rickettsiales bacterium]|nr:hypothetical protein [Rickettsiales bacterium]